jgi:multidrug efflux pump subunit AcrA (membrane-fusion protein)
MSQRGFLFAVVIGLQICFLAGCDQSTKKPKAEKKSPSKVEAHPDESDIYRVTLTPKAVERLGITTTTVESKSVPRFRKVGGIAMVPPGQSQIISAPVTGKVEFPGSQSLPKPGVQISMGEPLMLLIPLLSPERDVPTPAERVQIANAQVMLKSAQIAAAGDVERSTAEVAGAKIAFDRAQKLLADKAGSVRAVDETEATLAVAQKTLEAAQMRKKALDALSLDSKTTEAQPIPILTPDSGTLMNVAVTRGQTVTVGSPLVELADLETMWIRVPLYAGLLEEIRLKDSVQILNLQSDSKESSQVAKPVDAPPTGDMLSASIDLYYQIDNQSHNVRPGQRVTVQLPLIGDAENLVVPLAAVVHDSHGTAWVYGQDSENVFRRHRVFMKYSVVDAETGKSLAVLSSGPETGTTIVVEGVAELFGTEFGTGK